MTESKIIQTWDYEFEEYNFHIVRDLWPDHYDDGRPEISFEIHVESESGLLESIDYNESFDKCITRMNRLLRRMGIDVFLQEKHFKVTFADESLVKIADSLIVSST